MAVRKSIEILRASAAARRWRILSAGRRRSADVIYLGESGRQQVGQPVGDDGKILPEVVLCLHAGAGAGILNWRTETLC